MVFFQLVLKTKEFKDYTTQITKTQIKTIENNKTKKLQWSFLNWIRKKNIKKQKHKTWKQKQ